MELEQLRIFLSVAELKSITKTAERLFVSHSTVSRSISSLEAELGVKLFERGNKIELLTPAGEKLRNRAPELLSLAEDIENELHNI